MAEYHRHRRFRNVGRAIGHGVVNPVAQFARFIQTPSKTTPISESAAKDTPFKMVSPSPTMRERPRTVSVDSEGNVDMSQGMSDGGLSVGVGLSFGEGDSGSGSGSAERGSAPTSSGGTRSLLKETPIIYQQSHFGLSETVTKVLAQTSYISLSSQQGTPANTDFFQFRLNTPYDWFLTTLATTPTGNVLAGKWASQIRPSAADPITWPATPDAFPSTMTTTERPQWREYFEKHYAYYAVLGCEYELTFMNPSLQPCRDLVIATFRDSYSATNATQIHPTGRPMAEMEHWPDVTFKRVPSTGDGDTRKCYTTIKGYYRPGTMKTSVENDEDMKTWTKVAAQPSMTEIMTVAFQRAWDSNQNYVACANVRIDMRWIVQYKDLKNPYRWPSSTGQTAITATAPADILYNP